MDYMEAAAQLGQAIANSSEMKAWKDAEAALMEDEKGNTLMEEYRDAQMKMVRASREGLGQEGEMQRDASSEARSTMSTVDKKLFPCQGCI